MPHNSNHHMRLTWHRENYRSYCPACAILSILHYYPTGDYYCYKCIETINQTLKQSGIDPRLLSQENQEGIMVARKIIDSLNLVNDFEIKKQRASKLHRKGKKAKKKGKNHKWTTL